MTEMDAVCAAVRSADSTGENPVFHTDNVYMCKFERM